MEDPIDCLIDLNSPVLNNPRASLVPPIVMCQKSSSQLHNFVGPSSMTGPSLMEENNPFDMMVRQTEINEADKNDPFEIAFETACGYCSTTTDMSVITKDPGEPLQVLTEKTNDILSAKSAEILSDKSAEVPSENDVLKDCICEVSGSLDGVNLDDIQPPEFLVNSSFDLSENDSININDTLNLSTMSDFRITPELTKCSPLMEENCKTDDFLLGESAAMLKRKGLVNNETPKRVLSPIDVLSDPLTISEKSGSFEESPIKALCELKSEESVKTLIESRIQKCIARALNDSHQQFRHSVLLDAGETSFVSNQVKPPKANLRVSMSVPQNLHLLHIEESSTKVGHADVNSLSPVKRDLLEGLTIPVLDHKVESTKRSCSKSFDISTSEPESSAALTGAQSTSAIPNEKISQYREIIEAQLQLTEQEIARTLPEVVTESKPSGHRRSLSCDVIVPPQLATKEPSSPKLPPLPLSSETIRDLSLCSKYSPQTSKPPGHLPAKLTNRLVPMAACAQPKLVLKRKPSAANNEPVTATASFGGATKGPMKAVVPVRNMTRFTGSPRPSGRRGPMALSRQSSLVSPNVQKSKLCPLAASTPSTATVPDKVGTTRAPPVITAPSPRRISSGIPSPSRRSSNASWGVTTSNAKADTPTRKTSVSTYARNGHPRVLLDKNNGFTSPTTTPVRKPETQTAIHTQLPKGHSRVLGKENVVCPQTNKYEADRKILRGRMSRNRRENVTETRGTGNKSNQSVKFQAKIL